jgi:ABC-type lipoprotein release transport system permease subunit
MDSSIIVAILGFLGTILGSGLGVIASSKLTSYRIEQLEKKVDKHNGVIERTLILEEKVKEIAADVKELKEYHK